VPPPRRPDPRRLAAARHVIYLLFRQERDDPALTAEAIRLGRVVHRAAPDGETAGLLALLLFHEARRTARWDLQLLAEGRRLLAQDPGDAPCGVPGPFRQQALAVSAAMSAQVSAQVSAEVSAETTPSDDG